MQGCLWQHGNTSFLLSSIEFITFVICNQNLRSYRWDKGKTKHIFQIISLNDCLVSSPGLNPEIAVAIVFRPRLKYGSRPGLRAQASWSLKVPQGRRLRSQTRSARTQVDMGVGQGSDLQAIIASCPCNELVWRFVVLQLMQDEVYGMPVCG